MKIGKCGNVKMSFDISQDPELVEGLFGQCEIEIDKKN
jgi:hypothetical protein